MPTVVATNVTRIRREKRLSLRALAVRSGLSRQTIYNLAAATRGVRVSTLERIAKVLGVEVAELLRRRRTGKLS